jgi:hypothetical protein
MFGTCIFCRSPLGTNTAVEHLPVGRRLAFDPERGRLWVVCPHCRRWNLTPLEERWEAIEDCERLFREAVRRAWTEHISLAQVPAGVVLIRVGKPTWPEFAAWRYARQLTRRRARARYAAAAAAVAGGIAATAGAVVSVGAAAVLGVGVFPPLFHGLAWLQEYLDSERVVARIRPPDGHPRDVQAKHVGRMEIIPPAVAGAWRLSVAHRTGVAEVEGAAAAQMASQLLAQLNRWGASPSQVDEAVQRIAAVGGPDNSILEAVRLREERRRSGAVFFDEAIGVLGLTDSERLGLEMVVNEESERLALAGELAALEAAWRDAEEIAAIADNLLVPPAVRAWLERHRSDARTSPRRGGSAPPGDAERLGRKARTTE